MKLVLKIKLLPNAEQAKHLIDTIKQSNEVCNAISNIAWERKIFNRYSLHHEVYYPIKSLYKIGSQSLVSCISKVSNAYKINKKTKIAFRTYGSVPYDKRIISYKKDNFISILTVVGRILVPFTCHDFEKLSLISGQANLIYKKGKFYIFQTIDYKEENISDVDGFIGVDMGLLEIAALSNGKNFNSKELNDYRNKRQKVRSSLQSKGTKGCKKALKRLSGKERTTSTIINHTISKQIVNIAKETGKGVAVEDLKGIRFSVQNKGKKLRTMVGKWNFNQLRTFLAYKCLLSGVKFVVVPPAYTSKTCHNCLHIGDRKGKNFTCNNCNSVFDADENAAKNIALLGMNVNHPEKPSMLYCKVH